MSPRRARAVAGRIGDDPAAALRDHLIDAAERLTMQEPIASITTRDIARAADVSDGVLYNYFADKSELLIAALLRRYLRLYARFTEAIPTTGSGTVEENIASIAGTLLELEREFVPMIAGLVAEPALLHRLFATLHADPFGPQQFMAPLVAYLEGEQGLGRIRTDADLDAIALLLWGSTGLLALAGQLVPGADQPGAGRLDPIVDSLMRGLQPTG